MVYTCLCYIAVGMVYKCGIDMFVLYSCGHGVHVQYIYVVCTRVGAILLWGWCTAAVYTCVVYRVCVCKINLGVVYRRIMHMCYIPMYMCAI